MAFGLYELLNQLPAIILVATLGRPVGPGPSCNKGSCCGFDFVTSCRAIIWIYEVEPTSRSHRIIQIWVGAQQGCLAGPCDHCLVFS